MPDRRSRTTAPPWNSLVAAAKVMTSPDVRLRKASVGTPEAWQSDAWRFYDEVGELRFGVSWIANALSRVNLGAAMQPLATGDEPTLIDYEDERATPLQKRAVEIVDTIAGGSTGQGQMLAQFGIQLSVAGLAWLVIEPDLDDPGDDAFQTWAVYSSAEVRAATHGDGLEIRVGSREWRPVHPNGIVVKVWRRHPQRSYDADAPTRGVLGVLREIVMLQQHIQASAQSRLAGAGILAVPSEAVFPPGQGQSTGDNTNDDDQFVETLIDSMVTPISDRGSAAAVVPLVIKVPGEFVDKITHIKFDTPFDDRVLELMDGAIKRLALGLDIPPEILTGASSLNHWCLAYDAQAYTRNGWTDHSEIRTGTEVLAIDPATGRLVWDTVLDKYEAVLDNEPMLTVNVHAARRGEMAIRMTPGHRNVIERDGCRMIVTADQLQPGDLIPMCATATEWPTEAKFTDAFVRLLAWYSADGTLTSRPDGTPGQIRIAKSWQKNPDKVRALRDVLTDVFGPESASMPKSDTPMWRMEMQDRGMAVAVLNAAARDMILAVVPGKEKVIPRWLVDSFTQSQAESFLTAWSESDGSTRARKWTGVVEQSVPERLDALEYAAIKLGYPVKRYTSEKNGAGRFSDCLMHGVRIGQQDYRTVRSITQENATEGVWCPTTTTGTWLAKDAQTGWSFVTGNSAWQVAEEAITLHIEPLAEMIVHALTIGYLRPALLAEGWDRDEVEELMLWYDTSDLRTRPDRSGSAVEAYDRYELSGEALVRELGLGVDDAPTDDEKRTRLLIDIVRAAPAMAPAILGELGVNMEMPAIDVDEGSPIEIPEAPQPQGPPERAAILAAVDQVMHRAMERAGSRLRSSAGKNHPEGAAGISCADPALLHCEIDATAHDIGRLLAGAWVNVPVIAERYGVDPEALGTALDRYARSLLATGQAHTWERLAHAVTV